MHSVLSLTIFLCEGKGMLAKIWRRGMAKGEKMEGKQSSNVMHVTNTVTLQSIFSTPR